MQYDYDAAIAPLNPRAKQAKPTVPERCPSCGWSPLTIVVYYVIFHHIFRVPIPNFLAFFLLGFLMWRYDNRGGIVKEFQDEFFVSGKKQVMEFCRELVKSGYLARTIVLKLRYGDFTTLTRQITLAVPTNDLKQISQCAIQLLQKHWDKRRAVRLIGVGAHNLSEASSAQQLGFQME